MKVRFTPTARLQFLLAVANLKRERPSAAAQFRKDVERQLRRIEQYPESGRSLPEFPELPHREILVLPYRFFYRVKGKTIWVVAVWHGAQLPKPPNE